MPEIPSVESPAAAAPEESVAGATPPAAPPAPESKAKQKPAPKPPTPEELDGARSFFSREFPSIKFQAPDKKDVKEGEGDKEPSGNKEPKDKEKSTDKDKPAQPKAQKPPAKPKPAKPAPEKAPPITPEAIAEAAARGTAKALAETKTTAPAADNLKNAEENLTPAEKRKVAVLRLLEKKSPEKYSGIASKFIKSTVALEEYGAKWEAEHPGQTFDDLAAEHEDFFDKNNVDWDEDDFNDAATELRVQPIEEVHRKTLEELEGLKKKVELQESAATIGTLQVGAAVDYWSKLGEDMADVVAPDGTVNNAKLAELEKKAPEETALRVNAARALNAEVAEIHKVYNGLVTFQPKTNEIHQQIAILGGEMESKMLAMSPEDQQNEDGLPFMPSAKYAKLSPEEQARCWTFTAKDLIEMRSAQLAKMVKKTIEQNEEAHRRWAESKGIKLPGKEDAPAGAAASAPAEGEPDDDDGRTPPAAEKPSSPSASGESRGAAAKAGRGGQVGSGPVVSKLL
jgi:hypothetical protein